MSHNDTLKITGNLQPSMRTNISKLQQEILYKNIQHKTAECIIMNIGKSYKKIFDGLNPQGGRGFCQSPMSPFF